MTKVSAPHGVSEELRNGALMTFAFKFDDPVTIALGQVCPKRWNRSRN